MIKLYDVVLSGNCHKVRLLLSMLKLDYERVEVDFMSGEHKSEAFLAINPLGQVPVLSDGDVTLRDSQAILVYLARRYGDETWLPTDAADLARVCQWLSTAVNEIHHGPGAARLAVLFKLDIDLARAQTIAQNVLNQMETHLKDRRWLEMDHPTIADLACYPYSALAPQGEVSLDPYPAVRAWIARVESLPGYEAMPGLPYFG